jgi:ABC-type transport system substrate-binding protein
MARYYPCRILLLLVLFFPALAAERPVIYLRLTDSLTLDPGKVEDFYSQEVIFNIFEGLVQLKQDSISVEPCLAERWISRENGKRWIFYLRRGVRFHNGEEFNSRSVVYSFKKRMGKKRGEYISFGRFFPYITDIKALDDRTVEIILSRPYASFLFALVDLRASVVATGSCDDAEFNPVGTGPYVFDKWVKGKTQILIRNEHYWGQPPHLGKIIFKCEPTATLRLSQIRNQSADIDMIKSAKEYDELRDKTDILIISYTSPSTYYLGFNCRRAPFSHLGVRRSFLYLLDKKVLVKQIFQNIAEPAAGILPPHMPGFDPGIGQDEFSLEKAHRLLVEAGAGKGFTCSLYFSEGAYGLEEVARAITANARRVNITIRNVKLPFAKLFKAVQNGEPDLFLLGWGFTSDPGMFMNPLFMLYPENPGSPLAAGPEFVRILARAEKVADNEERGKLYAKAQRLLYKDLPLIPLFHLNHLMAYNRRLVNLHLNPFGYPIFKDVSLRAE